MRQIGKLSRLLVAGLLLTGLSASINAQDDKKQQQGADKGEMSMTGCLMKDTSGDGNYALTDQKTGVKTTVSGAADLEKHANHTVTLTGTMKSEAGGKSVFEVTKIQHVAASCKTQ